MREGGAHLPFDVAWNDGRRIWINAFLLSIKAITRACESLSKMQHSK